MKRAIGWLVGTVIISVFAAMGQAEEIAVDLQGEGRASDMTSIEKRVSPDEDLSVTIKGTSRYQMPSRGKFTLYTEKRQRIKAVGYSLQPGEEKSWEFAADTNIAFVNFGVYGKGAVRAILRQGPPIGAAEAGAVTPAPDLPGPVVAESSPATASGAFPSLLREAETSYHEGKTIEAIETLKLAVLEIWKEVPLTVKNARLVEDTQTYVTRRQNTFGAGERIHINAQIFGYALKQIGEAWSINITTDVYFLQGGEILAGQQNFGKFELITPIPSTEFRLDLTYWLNDAPAGAYDIQTVLHDQNSGQSTTFTTQINMK